MQPGDNYRVALSLVSAAALDALQVITPDAPTYVATDSDVHFASSALLSPLLTVWRKVHVEEDTMSLRPTAGDERNFSDGPVVSITPYGGYPGQFHLALKANPHFALDSTNRFQNGDIYIDGHIFNVLQSHAATLGQVNVVVKVQDDASGHMATLHSQGIPNASTGNLELDGEELPFQLFDDDGRDNIDILKLPYASPKALLTDDVTAKFVRAYIELVPASGNTISTVPFVTHTDAPHTFGRDLPDSANFWTCRVIAAHEPITHLVGNYEGDADPDTEPGDPEEGVTRNGDSLVFLEAIRELYRGRLALPNSASLATEIQERLAVVTAHEIGHNCNTDRPRYSPPEGGGLQSPDHGEGGLMAVGAAKAEFSALSIYRFRRATTWNRTNYNYD